MHAFYVFHVFRRRQIVDNRIKQRLGFSIPVPGVTDAIKGAKADGPAMGIAMKTLKSTGAAVEAPDVNAAVKKIRGG